MIDKITATFLIDKRYDTLRYSTRSRALTFNRGARFFFGQLKLRDSIPVPASSKEGVGGVDVGLVVSMWSSWYRYLSLSQTLVVITRTRVRPLRLLLQFVHCSRADVL